MKNNGTWFSRLKLIEKINKTGMMCVDITLSANPRPDLISSAEVGLYYNGTYNSYLNSSIKVKLEGNPSGNGRQKPGLGSPVDHCLIINLLIV